MKKIVSLQVLILLILSSLSCSKDSNSANGDSGIIRYEIAISEGSEDYDISLNTSALNTKVIDLDTGEPVPEGLVGIIQSISDTRSSYKVEAQEATVSMNLGLDFIENEISAGKPLELELQCYFNNELQDTYNYSGSIVLVGQFNFIFTPGGGLQVISEPQ